MINIIEKQKRFYVKPQMVKIKLDSEVSMVMLSPPGDPTGSITPEHFSLNPFKLSNLK